MLKLRMINIRNILLFAAVITYFGFCCLSKPAEPITNAFPVGTERSYTLINEVTINHKKGGKNVGYRVNGILKVGAIWGTDEQKLLKFHLISPKLQTKSKKSDDFVDQTSPLDKVSDLEFYATWDLGKITKSFFSKKEDPSVLNLKKGLISLFQYQLMDGRYAEEDVSGSCDVTYRTKSVDRYEKLKTNCRSEDLGYHSRDSTAIGVSVVSWRMSDFVVTQDGTLDKVESREYHEIAVNAYKNAGGGLESVLSLKFDGSISNIPAIKEATIGAALKSIKGIKSQPLASNVDLKAGRSNTPNLKDLVKSLKDDLTNENVGKFRSAMAIANMVPAARTTTKDELLRILKSHTMKDYRGQLLDLMAATQTKESHEAVRTIIDFTSAEHQTDAERYLQSLAIGTRPKATVIKELLQLTEKKFSEPKMKDTLIQTIASMGYRYGLADQNFDSGIVKEIEEYLLQSLKACKEPLSKVKYIRALQNLQSPNVKSVLWTNVYDGERLVTVSAMKALRSYPNRFWLDDDKKEFLKVFYQQTRQFDSSARTLALDVILELQPSVTEIKELLHFLRSNDKAFEVKQYLLQNLIMKGDRCPEFKLKLKEALFDEPLLNNYHIIGQKGLSTALSRKFSKPPSFNGTLLSIQETHGGVLKRGVVDMTIDTSSDHFSLFTLGLYAAGLSSFMGGSDDDNNADESTTAGMEIKVQGSYFRPLEFFNGQGELMGHVFSGTASEPTKAYTATTLLHDHEETLRLHNGASLRVNVLGGLSIDLNGQVQLSLWYKNAHCQVDKNMGIALTGSISSETSFVSLDLDFTITEEPKLQLLTDSEFSSDVQLCMQLTQPDVVMRHDITKVQQVPGYTLRRKLNFVHRLPGFTHYLNRKNNDMCRSILS